MRRFRWGVCVCGGSVLDQLFAGRQEAAQLVVGGLKSRLRWLMKRLGGVMEKEVHRNMGTFSHLVGGAVTFQGPRGIHLRRIFLDSAYICVFITLCVSGRKYSRVYLGACRGNPKDTCQRRIRVRTGKQKQDG